jgi:hypothetical protein
MKLHTPIFLSALIIGAPAISSPVLLECVTENPATARGITHQIAFDELAQTVALDGRKPVKARITDTLITWTSTDQYGTYAWRVDRLSGAWSAFNGSGVNGKCTAPPSRQF